MTLLAVEGLTVTYPGAPAPAVRGLTVDLEAGGSLGLVGGSGSGKSTLALALLGLLPPGSRVTGSVLLDGEPLPPPGSRRWRRVRGGTVGLVFQDPQTALSPHLTIGGHLLEVLAAHQVAGGAGRARDLLAEVGLPDPAGALGRYPHEFSGGQRQRIGIALALAGGPRLLVADEPTTALDVTVQQRILALLARMVHERGLALLLISHDLGVIGGSCARVAVLERGLLVEHGPTDTVFAAPAHQATRSLLAAVAGTGGPA